MIALQTTTSSFTGTQDLEIASTAIHEKISTEAELHPRAINLQTLFQRIVPLTSVRLCTWLKNANRRGVGRSSLHWPLSLRTRIPWSYWDFRKSEGSEKNLPQRDWRVANYRIVSDPFALNTFVKRLKNNEKIRWQLDEWCDTTWVSSCVRLENSVFTLCYMVSCIHILKNDFACYVLCPCYGCYKEE